MHYESVEFYSNGDDDEMQQVSTALGRNLLISLIVEFLMCFWFWFISLHLLFPNKVPSLKKIANKILEASDWLTASGKTVNQQFISDSKSGQKL